MCRERSKLNEATSAGGRSGGSGVSGLGLNGELERRWGGEGGTLVLRGRGCIRVREEKRERERKCE